MSLVHQKSDELAKHYCEEKDKDRREAGRWNATLRISSVLWTNGASCNSNLWTLVSILSRHPYLWIFQPLFLWIDPIYYSFHLFIDGKSIWQGLACSQERLAGDHGVWVHIGAVTRYGLSMLFCFTEQWFPLSPVILNYTLLESRNVPDASFVTPAGRSQKTKPYPSWTLVPFPSLKIDFWNLRYMWGGLVSASSPIFFFERAGYRKSK